MAPQRARSPTGPSSWPARSPGTSSPASTIAPGIGFRALDALRTDVVRGPRGAITRDDFILTRVIELVVHGDDLARSVPAIEAPPLLDASRAAVSGALAQAYAEVTGREPEIGDHLMWIRAATGRTPSEDEALPLL